MTEGVLFVCKAAATAGAKRRRGGEMSEREEGGPAVELLLLEPEIVAWLDDYRPEPDDEPDDEPPRAA
jgi:hypothetical protein